MKPTVLFLVGPTASGKSRIALELAKDLDAEIISADSMLVYKGMDIGTAKPSKPEREKIPHHLIDIVAPSRNFSVFEFRKRALKEIAAISRRGKLPLIVGGSGLYVRVLLQGLAEQPGADLKLRKKLKDEIKKKSLAVLYKRLQKKDPLRAGQIRPEDERRIIRALEIAEKSKKKPSSLFGKEKGLEDLGYRPLVFGITKDRAELYKDIEQRVDLMFEKGLVAEVRNLMKKRLSRTAGQAVGYKEVIAALKGQYSLEKARELVKIGTRHLAKRQWTWFKREQGIQWFMWEGGESAKNFAAKVLEAYKFQKGG